MIRTTATKGQKSTWEAKKQFLKKNFPKLSTADLNFEESRKEEMFVWLEGKLALTRKELEYIIAKIWIFSWWAYQPWASINNPTNHMKLAVTNYTSLGSLIVSLISRINEILTIDRHTNLTGSHQRLTERFDVVMVRDHVRNVFK